MSSPPQNPFNVGWSDGFRTDPIVSISDWADKNIVISSVDSAEPGAFRTARTPYVREIVECLAPQNPAQRVVWMAASQVAKTRTGLNWIGYIIDCAPGPTMLVQPTVDTAKRVSKQRLAPMLENVDCLREKIKPSRERDSGNTILEKEFSGGMLIMAGANSAVGLRSMPARNLFLDEVDGYPLDVDGEGDPISLAEKRTGTFGIRRKIFISSTPTIKGISRIESEYDASDCRRYFVPCPHCGFFDWIRWKNIKYTEDPSEPKVLLDEPKLLCEACGVLIEERFKTQMLDRGQWRPTRKSDGRTIGFHLSALYSPLGWKNWSDIVAEWLDAKKEPRKLKTFLNTVLGETWEERGDQLDADTLKSRLEDYGAEVPAGVGMLVGSVDVQGDRLEWVCKGYGAGEESWLIGLGQIPGDPAKDAVWLELDKELTQTFEHPSGRKLAMRAVAIDSGGLHTDQVYKFCKPRELRRVAKQSQRVCAIKGVGGSGREILGRPSKANRYQCKLFPLGVDTAKDTIFSRMHIEGMGPGYMHLPAWADEEYLAQLTSEKAIRRYKKGVGAVREYVKQRERNEGLDLEVYALAALYILGRATVQRLGVYAVELNTVIDPNQPPAPLDDPPTPPPAPSPTRPKPPTPRSYMSGYGGKGYINRWKK
jgi:phage terminase large subunit GpA-like protein